MLLFIHLTNIFYVARELMFGYKSQMLSKCGQNKNRNTRGAASQFDIYPLWSVTEQTLSNMGSIGFAW